MISNLNIKTRIPLIDFNAEFGSFERESNELGLDYQFQHINSLENADKFVVMTDKAIKLTNSIPLSKYLWIMEPNVIHSWVYDFVLSNYHKFILVFTHSKELLSKIPNAVWYPWGSYFIPRNQHLIYEKTKNVSIVASSKNSAEGHQMRHDIISRFGNRFDGVKHGGHVEPKFLWHKDYRFSVVVENSFSPGYFTEKIIDCFRTGVIPVYKGDPDILNYGFDNDGILTFENLDDLGRVLDGCNEELYLSRLKSVKSNFYSSFEFLFPWKFIFPPLLNSLIENELL